MAGRKLSGCDEEDGIFVRVIDAAARSGKLKIADFRLKISDFQSAI
jgi:hypothetical protein